MSAKLTISIPEWLDRICASPVMLYRKHKYGYSYRRIYLGEREWTLLDEEDFYRYGNLKLSLGGFKKNFYAVSGVKNKDGNFELVRLHRLLMNSPKGRVVDHRNGDGLDNRRENLRIATRGQNVCNKIKTRRKTSSKFIGVSWDKRSRLWAAYVGHLYKKIFLGYFKNEIDAARAYDRAAIKYHGEFARLNFPREDYIKETTPSIMKG
jgi:hypothetical protein